jgi:hypothetical protein
LRYLGAVQQFEEAGIFCSNALLLNPDPDTRWAAVRPTFLAEVERPARGQT